MKNKSLIIIVISLFFIAEIYGSDKSYGNISETLSAESRIIPESISPYVNLSMNLDYGGFYRPIYVKQLGLQKNEEESPKRLEK